MDNFCNKPDSNTLDRNSNIYSNFSNKNSEIELPSKNEENIFPLNNLENNTPNYNNIIDNSETNIQNPNDNFNFSDMLLTTNLSKFNEHLVNQEFTASVAASTTTPVTEPICTEIPEVNINRKNCKIFWFYLAFHLFMLFFSFPLVILVFKICSKIKYSEYYYFQRIHDNWTKPPISKITTDSCEAFENQLIQNSWSGTQSGCNCYTYIKTSGCSRKSSCRNVAAISPIPISFWRGRRLCRESGEAWSKKTYFDISIEKNAENCSAGTSSCGVIDSLGSHLCVESTIPCPVNSINFYSVIEFDKVKDSIPKNNAVIQLSNGFLVYGNNRKNYVDINKVKIPIEYKVSNAQPCLNPFYENISFPIYILDLKRGRQQCLKHADMDDNTKNSENLDTNNQNTNDFYYNPDFYPLDTISQEVLFKENGITAKTSNLPLFPKDQYKNDITLYFSNYFALKPSCYKEIKQKNLSDEVLRDLKKVSEISSYSVFFLRIITIIYILIFFVMLFMGFTILVKPKGKKTVQKINSNNMYIYACFACCAELLIILLILCLINLQTKVGIGNEFIKVFSDSSCVDNFTIDLYMQLVPDILYIKSAANWGVFLCIVVFVLYIVFFSIGKKYTAKGDAIYYDN